MKYLALKSPAKINLNLKLIGQYPNGYHELQSLVVPISICDLIKVRLLEDGEREDGDCFVRFLYGFSPRVSRKDEDFVDGNLILTAAASLFEYGVDNIEISLIKRIPMGAGLGGGSSNAATVLHLLDKIFRLRECLKINNEELFKIAMSIGSDVPFFLDYQQRIDEHFRQSGKTCATLIEGMGEKIRHFDIPIQRFFLIFSDLHFSTAEIFGSEMKSFSDKLEDKKLIHSRENDLFSAALAHSKRFELLVTTLNSDLEDYFTNREPLRLQMSGSGSTLFIRITNLCKQETEDLRNFLKVKLSVLSRVLELQLELFQAESLK